MAAKGRCAMRLPPSARFVLKVLSEGEPMTIGEIAEETGLPLRTVKFALRRLRELGLVSAVPCVRDLRRKFYFTCYKLSGSGRRFPAFID